MVHQLRSTLLAQRSVFSVLNSRGRRNPLQAGFTLVELLVVVIILAVLAVIAVPAFLNQQGRARVAAAQTAAMDAARACAAAQITGDQGLFALPPGTAGACGAPAAVSNFNSLQASFGTTANAVATVAANGQVSLTTCAFADGWAGGLVADGCAPTRG